MGNTNTVPRAHEARAPPRCDTCASIFINDHTAQARRSQTVTAATSGSLRNIPSMLSSLLSFAPSPRVARAPPKYLVARLRSDTVSRTSARNSESHLNAFQR